MVKLRVKLGPKGQIVIPKMLRDAYKIREGIYVIIEPKDDGIKITGVDDPDEVLQWIQARRARMKGIRAKDANLIIYLNVPMHEDEARRIEKLWLHVVRRHEHYTNVLVLDEVIHVSRRKYGVPSHETIELIDKTVIPLHAGT